MEIRDVIFRIEQERKEQNAIYHAAAAKFGLTEEQKSKFVRARRLADGK